MRTGAIWMLVAAVAIAAPLVVAAPLAAYTLTLATFGLPHVVSELRYVDRRFSLRMGRAQLVRVLALLGLIVSVRSLTVFHVFAPFAGVTVELSLVALLALSVASRQIGQRALALGVARAIGIATAFSPYETAVAFSILHNFTPLAFLWQIAPQEKRLNTVLIAGAGFVGIPLCVASGLPREVFATAGLTGAPDPLLAGPLAAHLFVYVPRAMLHSAHAVDFFSASVIAQIAHYVSVVVLLPYLLEAAEPEARGLVPWPRLFIFFGLLAAAGALSFFVFSADFAGARSLYGIAASFHAWAEIPILILALTSLSQAKISAMPATHDAKLAMSDTVMAR